MAQYKVPQDVEAEDKLIGPFSFRQFIYLLVVAGFIALSWALFQASPILAIIPLPIIIFFSILALPLKKDQPMETYLAAIVSFYLKPRKRLWVSGQSESLIEITAPKTVEETRVRNITGEEASYRLSFLADVVDSEGRSVIDNTSSLKDEYVAEANNTYDILDTASTYNIDRAIDNEKQARHDALIEQMRTAIKRTQSLTSSQNQPISISKFNSSRNILFNQPPSPTQPDRPLPINPKTNPQSQDKAPAKPPTAPPDQLNPDQNNQTQEVFISLR